MSEYSIINISEEHFKQNLPRRVFAFFRHREAALSFKIYRGKIERQLKYDDYLAISAI
jgi:hypothetical protein